ncbi:MAG: CPBP family intramembrane metalloprotease [Planctomycetota bacterium]|nr:CPBP family intramembrane metalloprotease [Planctomycetota bacterium]
MSRAASARNPKNTTGASSCNFLVQAMGKYFIGSELPLTILVFLLPMLVMYEVGTRYFASDWARHAEMRVLAFTMFRQFMELFGASGRYLPPLAVVGILLAMHIARRDPWKFQVGTAFGMVVESALLALPLLALGSLLRRYLVLYAGGAGARSGFVLALGAGIYEELVFRLMAFTVLNILLIDLLQVGKWAAYVLIVVSSSVLFAAYHYWGPMAEPFRLSDFAFRTVAGAYFGWLFITRGFGITAGSHVAYDMYYFGLRALGGF